MRRNPFAVAAVLVLSVNTSNCNLTDPVDHPVAGFSHSVATFQCGPADGPATAILLARDPIEGLDPSRPYVRVVIQRQASALPGTAWIVGSMLGDVSAVYSTASGATEQARSGTVRITSVAAQERVEGNVELRFPSHVVSGGFSAPWIESFILCG